MGANASSEGGRRNSGRRPSGGDGTDRRSLFGRRPSGNQTPTDADDANLVQNVLVPPAAPPVAPVAGAPADPVLDAPPRVQLGGGCADPDAPQVQQLPQQLLQQRHVRGPPHRLSNRGNMLSRASLGGANTPDPSTFNDDDELEVPEAAASSSAAAAAAAAQPEPELGQSGALTVSTRVEYAAIPSGQSQDVFGIVTLQAAAKEALQSAAAEETPRQPLDIICVLDVSGSMSGEKLRLVQGAVRFVVNECQPQDRLSIVTFNSGSSRALRLCRMTPDGKNEATVATLRLNAGGGTNISSGVETALQIAERRRYRNPVSAILLLTDGQDGRSSASLPGQIQRAQALGCSLYAFGFGVDHDARLLAEVAEMAQTPFTYVEDVDQISPAFAGAVGGLTSVAAQQVEVSLQCPMTLKKIHTPFPTTREGQNAVIKIPDMLAGERRDILVEVNVPEGASGDDTLLLSATAKYFDLAANATVQSEGAEMRLLRVAAEEPQPEMEPDEEVTTQRNRVEVAQTLQDAANHGDAGRFEEARNVIETHEKRLNLKKKNAVSQALASELEEARERMSSRASWEDGGMAELRDAMQMHKMQRATNLNVSVKSKASRYQRKEMYTNSVQKSWIAKSSMG